MSETKSLAAPKASFDRRAVVKGAAWSVPVIAAAIAAPAAAASVVTTPSLTIDGEGTPINFDSATPKHHGTAPTSFTIDNPGALSTGAISGSITITPTTTPKKQARIGVNGASPGSVSQGKADNNNSITTTFNYAGIPGKSSMVFPLRYSYARSANETAFGSYTIVVSLKLSTTPATNLSKSANITETAV
jgi:hypothetical protein